MPIHGLLTQMLPPTYLEVLKAADEGNLVPLRQRIAGIAATDSCMQPYCGETGTKYYKSFVQTVAEKIEATIITALASGGIPEIEVSYLEIEAKRIALGIPAFGSPQDVLYGFTSERYPNWGSTLDQMFFRSACMVGEGKALVTMAPRILELGEPHVQTEELEGAITRDFFESNQRASHDASFRENLLEIYEALNLPYPNETLVVGNIDIALAQIRTNLENALDLSIPIAALRAKIIMPAVDRVKAQQSKAARIRSLTKLLGERHELPSVSQEQIALKYVEEGKFLQKILGGARADHLQSNVKMQANALRKNKIEVDSIYRVLGEKRLIFVEAKDKPTISRTQLYQIYETFRLRLPRDWKLNVIAVLRPSVTDQQKADGFTTVIDLVDLSFDDSVLGRITESIAAVAPKLHYRWLIRKQTNLPSA